MEQNDRNMPAGLEAGIRACRRTLSHRLRRNIARLAQHLNDGEEEVFRRIFLAAIADCARDGGGGEGLCGQEILLQDGAGLRRRFERKYLRYHLKREQRLVRPTWASIFVGRLSGETCALWVKAEREEGHRLQLPFELRDVVYLSEEAFRRIEARVILPLLQSHQGSSAGRN